MVSMTRVKMEKGRACAICNAGTDICSRRSNYNSMKARISSEQTKMKFQQSKETNERQCDDNRTILFFYNFL